MAHKDPVVAAKVSSSPQYRAVEKLAEACEVVELDVSPQNKDAIIARGRGCSRGIDVEKMNDAQLEFLHVVQDNASTLIALNVSKRFVQSGLHKRAIAV